MGHRDRHTQEEDNAKTERRPPCGWRGGSTATGHRLVANTGRGRGELARSPQRERGPASTLGLDLRPPDGETIRFRCFKAPSVWGFPRAALGLTQTVASCLDQSCLDSGAAGAHLPLVKGTGNKRIRSAKRAREKQKHRKSKT